LKKFNDKKLGGVYFWLMEKTNFQKRQTAFKANIKTLIVGDYIKEDGINPNYIKNSNGLKISRANVIALIIAKSNESSALIDDGTGQILIRRYDQIKLDEFEVGDLIQVIGKPREYNSERIIIPEIITKVEKKWFDVRKKELFEDEPILEKVINDDRADKPAETQILGDKGKVFEYIKENDSGGGIDIDKIIKSCGVLDAEKIVNNLLKDGEIFEITSGKIKVLE